MSMMVVGDVQLMKQNGAIYLAHVAITGEDIALIRASFQKIAATGDRASALFYRRLFEAEPELEALFPLNLESQQKKFTQMLAVLVEKLDTPELVTELLKDLGRRHAGYDVKDEHYDKVGQILLQTFAELLGDDCDAKTTAAWSSLYRVFAFLMKKASTLGVPSSQYYRVMLQGVLVAQYGADVMPTRGGRTV
ncbi:MAG: hypothetical protein H7X92_08330 [Chitinophagales bacterium]|nr:hypothetical protein [Hyphomicrobiales bacterium]